MSTMSNLTALADSFILFDLKSTCECKNKVSFMCRLSEERVAEQH